MFQVGSKSFVQTWKGRVIIKLDRNRQELLFEARPDVFSPFTAGALRWSYVAIEALDAEMVAELVEEAWSMVVSKKVSRAFTARPR